LCLEALHQLVFINLIVKLNEELATFCVLVEGSLKIVDLPVSSAPDLRESKRCGKFWGDVETENVYALDLCGLFL
jgi:hypothetical protein